jgi:hypothetical protein
MGVGGIEEKLNYFASPAMDLPPKRGEKTRE